MLIIQLPQKYQIKYYKKKFSSIIKFIKNHKTCIKYRFKSKINILFFTKRTCLVTQMRNSQKKTIILGTKNL